jgi:hypothetical protein
MHENFPHILLAFGPQILSLLNFKNQPNGKKGIILLVALSKWIL